MLFNSTAPAIVKEALQGAGISANAARKDAIAKRLDYYCDQQIDHLAAALSKRFSKPEKLTPAFINVVRKVTDRLAMTYCEPASRAIEGSQQNQDIFAEISQQCALDVKLKQASRLAKLCKTILVRPVWRNGAMDLDLLTGNILDVETGDSPEELKAVLVTHFGQTNRVEEIEYSLWTALSVARLDYRGRTLDRQAHPYRVLPFLPCWDSPPTDSFWLPGGDDLVTLQEAINNQLTGLLYTCDMQGFGVGWVKSSGARQNLARSLEVGPGSMVQLDSTGDLGYAATNAPISEILGVIDSLIKWAAVSNGLPASSLSTDPTEESGVSKLVSNSELQEKRRDDIALWRSYEHRLFDLIRIVWNVHNPGRKIGDKATLKIDFADSKPVVSAKERTENWEKLLGLGVITQVDIALERNPDLKTRENALAYLLALQQENQELGEQNL